MRKLMRNQSGSVLLAITLMMPFIILIAALYTEMAMSGLATAKRDQSHTHAQLSADAGVDAALEAINLDETWAGTGVINLADPCTGAAGEVEVQNDGKVRTTYQVSVNDTDDTHKEVVSVGCAYRPATATTGEAEVKLSVNLRAVTSGEFSVASGVGGLIMDNSSKIMGGDVLINGEIIMSNTAQIGLTTKPVTVKVAHQICPIGGGAGYPSLCGSGNGEPITINNTAHIYGTVQANNQTSGNGMSNPGLTGSSGVTPQPLPPHNRATQKANVLTTTSDAYYTSCNSNTTRTWSGRLKIVGNVTIGNQCRIILEGDVWITGSLTVRNSGRITTSDSITLGGQNTVDTRLPTLMIDGQTGATIENSGGLLSNASDVGMQLITYWSRAACSPDCADVTGTDLYSSRNDKTLTLRNNAEAPNTILYARWTQVDLSNGGSIGAVVGQTVKLSNSASISFGVSAGAGTTSWVINNYKQIN